MLCDSDWGISRNFLLALQLKLNKNPEKKK